MIAVDAIDALYEPVTMYPFHGDFLTPDRLSVMEAFRVLDKSGRIRETHTVKRGVVLAATTNRYTNMPSLFESVRARVPFAAQHASCPVFPSCRCTLCDRVSAGQRATVPTCGRG